MVGRDDLTDVEPESVAAVVFYQVAGRDRYDTIAHSSLRSRRGDGSYDAEALTSLASTQTSELLKRVKLFQEHDRAGAATELRRRARIRLYRVARHVWRFAKTRIRGRRRT